MLVRISKACSHTSKLTNHTFGHVYVLHEESQFLHVAKLVAKQRAMTVVQCTKHIPEKIMGGKLISCIQHSSFTHMIPMYIKHNVVQELHVQTF